MEKEITKLIEHCKKHIEFSETEIAKLNRGEYSEGMYQGMTIAYKEMIEWLKTISKEG